MLLSAKFINDVTSVNSFEPTEFAEFTQGDQVSVFFQLVDVSVDRPTGRRFIPETGSTLSCVVSNINDAVQITRFAVNPFPDDRSIWRLDFFNTDTISGTSSLLLTLSQGAFTTKCVVKNAFRIQSKSL